ncbi:Competence protein F homolog, phosphoribosyltransferase domain; protein YhgH required for utilization of DNA as sole source of carbon and energy [hydrothermal vent metagenome]|uniref:Competence protein F homolog, phosphoribosyltransferase domain protein YhgH required for utilization of DNA as sole source of carbon and energy n=1 Tax=hydrothermal vent metagenome TaxID=652676 RepID=A0A3B0S5G0_9ZZZZ
MAVFASLLNHIVDFALPPRCPVCGVTVEENHRFCLGCWQRLNFLSEPWCATCGRPFAFEHANNTKCASCLTKPPDHDGVRAVVAYDKDSASLAMGLKYGARLGFADLIANHMSRFVDEDLMNSIIVPVPLHRWRLWSRGFNQSVLIGRSLAKKHGIPIRTDLLIRNKATPPLRSMSSRQRLRIVSKAFRVPNSGKKLVSGKSIILVDDVYTSGSTANTCAKSLKRAGAKQVVVFCWARVLKDDNV